MAEMKVQIEGVTPVGGELPVTGTMAPSGTQDVAIVTPTTFPVSGTVTTVPGTIPGANFYAASFSSVAGQTGTPYNFLSLFNPLASGKTIVPVATFIIPWASGAAGTFNSMETFRTTAASGGTLLSGAGINKFVTASPSSVAEIRTVNPTITVVGPTFGGIPPVVSTTGSGTGAIGNVTAPSGSLFSLVAGEGVCYRQVVAGDADQLWNLGFIWMEI